MGEIDPTDTACYLSKSAASGDSELALGSKLGKYVVGDLLGKGGMGAVYRGFDPLVERDVALKVMPTLLATNPSALKRFLVEARAIGRVMHPNTVALYEIGQIGDSYFLAMEFAPGGSLAGKVKSEGRIPWPRATRYATELCHGLTAAHAVGLIHRDVKPENLLLTADDHVKITDFGLAKVIDSVEALSLTNPGDLLGTPHYMSPEQFSGGALDARTDLYSAGATYYQLLTGRQPFVDSTTILQMMYAHCNASVPDPRAVQPELPAACFEILKRAMAKAAGDRYRTAAEMAAALSAVTAPPAAKPAPTVWLVEPSKLQARIFQRDLMELGIQSVRTFATIADVMAALRQGAPTGVISAMHLDDGTGDDLVAQVRAVESGRDVLFFLVSSDAQATVTGANYPGRPVVLSKPVTREMLAEVVQRLSRV
jgi:serine/threonine protein kinase